jgi:hypothetical protein
MEYFVAIGVAALLEALQDKRALLKILPKVAKVYVAIERVAETSAPLAAAIERARSKV